jgi:hypothetical protein
MIKNRDLLDLDLDQGQDSIINYSYPHLLYAYQADHLESSQLSLGSKS